MSQVICRDGENAIIEGSTYVPPTGEGTLNTPYPTGSGQEIKGFFKSGDTVKVGCSTSIANVNVRVGTNCPNPSTIQECDVCQVAQDAQYCQFDLSRYLFFFFYFFLLLFYFLGVRKYFFFKKHSSYSFKTLASVNFFFLHSLFLNFILFLDSGPCGSIEPDHFITVKIFKTRFQFH